MKTVPETVILVVLDGSGPSPASEIAYMVAGTMEAPKVVLFRIGDDPIELLTWCSRHGCAALEVFSPATVLAGRAWLIKPEDDDAAFALKMRWL